MTPHDAPLSLHPDRLLPANPVVRPIARRLYHAVRAARAILAIPDADLATDDALAAELASGRSE